MMKYIWLVIGIVLLTGVVIQFTSPAIVNPPVTGELTAPQAVTQIFERACYDCHSNKTQLKWYDKIAPISWQVSKDVHQARSRFNFSEWDKLTAMERQTILWQTVNAISAGKMPLKSYAAVHPGAKVSAAEIETLKSYVNSLPNNKMNDVKGAEEEWKHYRRNNNLPDTIPVALNGVKYITDYKKWQVISTTNRFDNYTIRVVYGNDITVKAIKENNIHPFPNGAAIAKVVWNKLEDADGNIRPGTFNAVQIMTKDDDRYKETGGWGFAIFSGLQLKPFGKTITYQNTCFNCHKQLASENGYVFNVPLKNSELNKKIMAHAN